MSRIGKQPVAVPAGVKSAWPTATRRRRRPAGQARLASFRPRGRRVEFDEAAKQHRGHSRRRQSPGPGLARPEPGLGPEHGRRASPRATRRSWRSSASVTWPRSRRTSCRLRVGFANEIHMPIPAGPERHLPRSDARRHQGDRQADGRPVRRRSARRPQARAVQGQGHPLRRRSGPPQGRQGDDEVSRSGSAAVQVDMHWHVSRGEVSRESRKDHPHQRQRRAASASASASAATADASAVERVPQPQAHVRPGDRRRAGAARWPPPARPTRNCAARLKYGGNKTRRRGGRQGDRRAGAGGRNQASRASTAATFQYHGRVAALADAAREAGLSFVSSTFLAISLT